MKHYFAINSLLCVFLLTHNSQTEGQTNRQAMGQMDGHWTIRKIFVEKITNNRLEGLQKLRNIFK